MDELDEVLGPILDYLTEPRDHGDDGMLACGHSCCEPWLKGQHMSEEPQGVVPPERRRRRHGI